MTARIASAIVGMPVLALSVWAGGLWFSLLLALAAVMASLELCGMARRWGSRPMAAGAAVWAGGLVGGAHLGSVGVSVSTALPALAGAGLVASLAQTVASPRNRPGLTDWGITLGVALATGGLLGYGPLLRGLEQGRAWVFFLIFVVFAADTAAFIVGRRIGRRPLAPAISPRKTWEGAVAGLLGGTGAGVALIALFGLNVAPAVAAGFGALISAVGQLGDLTESWLKRIAGVKDSGWVIPGHGGVLDRLDSIVFNLALVYHLVIWVAQ